MYINWIEKSGKNVLKGWANSVCNKRSLNNIEIKYIAHLNIWVLLITGELVRCSSIESSYRFNGTIFLNETRNELLYKSKEKEQNTNPTGLFSGFWHTRSNKGVAKTCNPKSSDVIMYRSFLLIWTDFSQISRIRLYITTIVDRRTDKHNSLQRVILSQPTL